MPKELARVVAHYGVLQTRVDPLLNELARRVNDFIVLRDAYTACLDELAKDLKGLGVRSPADPKAQRDGGVAISLRDLERYGSLMEARRDEWDVTALKIAGIRKNALDLQKEVLAVVKAKSGFFSQSKSLPQLKALSVTLTTFADKLQHATTIGA